MRKPQRPVRDGNESTSTDTEERFLGRWSRLKSEAGTDGEVPDIRLEERMPARGEGQVNTPEEKTDADMPPLESLNADSDYSAFFSSKVSEELRRLALRKLFGCAKFNLRDGLDDYDEDFRDLEVLGDILTCDMRHRIEGVFEEPNAEREGRILQSETTARTTSDGLEPDSYDESKGTVSGKGGTEGTAAKEASPDEAAKS